jgi:hypothetical protein
VIDRGRRGNAARWINHSCAPNCSSFEDDDGRVFIEARRAIAAGEELTYDYPAVDRRAGSRAGFRERMHAAAGAALPGFELLER